MVYPVQDVHGEVRCLAYPLPRRWLSQWNMQIVTGVAISLSLSAQLTGRHPSLLRRRQVDVGKAVNPLNKIQERGLHLTFAATFFFFSFFYPCRSLVCLSLERRREESRIGDKKYLTVRYWQKLMGICEMEVCCQGMFDGS